jgi:hypothetical protein
MNKDAYTPSREPGRSRLELVLQVGSVVCRERNRSSDSGTAGGGAVDEETEVVRLEGGR